MANKIKLKRGLETNLPTLDVGEPAFTTDTKKPFIGSDIGNVELATKEYLDGQVDTIVANVTVDSEVILARGEETTLGGRLDKLALAYAQQKDRLHDNAGAHNSIFRGKNLGNTVTPEQYANIANSTFKDMYIGDYWTINSRNYRIAAFNYYRNTGDTSLSVNHVTLVPDANLYNHVMNDTAITTGGYTNSKMYSEGLEQAKTIINEAFPGHVITHRKYLSNAVSGDNANAGAWFDSQVDLMNEAMVYGGVINGNATLRGLFNIGSEKSQLPLFALNPQSINTRQTYWLRDVVTAAYFARVDYYGFAYYSGAAASFGVRPAFSIS